MIPIRKSADWWGLDQNKRAAMMQEHTEAALPYNKTVKRKLYHSTGLDDLDFITYFETSKLEDFHSLILAMEKVKEFPYNRTVRASDADRHCEVAGRNHRDLGAVAERGNHDGDGHTTLRR